MRIILNIFNSFVETLLPHMTNKFSHYPSLTSLIFTPSTWRTTRSWVSTPALFLGLITWPCDFKVSRRTFQSHRVSLENPMVCTQDGFHVMNGNEFINLTTEANKICQGRWKEVTEDVCPKVAPNSILIIYLFFNSGDYSTRAPALLREGCHDYQSTYDHDHGHNSQAQGSRVRGQWGGDRAWWENASRGRERDC